MKEGKYFLIVILIFLILRIFFVSISDEKPLHGDAFIYNKIAVLLMSGQTLGEEQTYSYPPLYPMFLAGAYKVFGYRFLPIKIIQSIMNVISCILIFLIAKRLFGKTEGWLALLLSLSYVIFIKMADILTTESLFVILFLLSLYILMESLLKTNFRLLFISGLILGISTLVRGSTLLLPLFICVGIFCLLKRKYGGEFEFKKVFKYISVLLISFILPISIWTIRNYMIYDTLVPVSTQGGTLLYASYFPPEGKYFGKFPGDKDFVKSLEMDSELERNRFLMQKVFEFIKSNPKGVVKLGILKFFYLWAPFDWEIIGAGKYNYFYGFILPFFITGIFLTIRKSLEYLVLYIPIVYFQIIAILTYGSPRFRIAIEPFLIILAAVGLKYFFGKFRKKYVPIAILSVFLAVNLSLYFYSDIFKESCRVIFSNIGLW